MIELQGQCYHSARGLAHELHSELGLANSGAFTSSCDPQLLVNAPQRAQLLYKNSYHDEELIFLGDKLHSAYWVRNIWRKPLLIEFSSIGDAAKKLRAIQRNWVALGDNFFRRRQLIVEKLPPLKIGERNFPYELPSAPLGSFMLLSENLLIASAQCSSPFPHGEINFVEDRIEPPSRAYRKIWEALIYAKKLPQAGERCLDAGASPGGWTWALAKLGCRVLSIDRAMLATNVASMAGVEYMQHDAFTLKPEEIGPVDWLCSDVIAYPPTLFAWVEKWLASGLAKNFICTIKMQGEFDAATTRLFAAIPDSQVIHLWHNKHELTWIKVTQG